MIEVQKKLKANPAQRNLPCILRGSHSKTVILFVTPNSGVVLDKGVIDKHHVGQFLDALIHYNDHRWESDGHAYTLSNQDL